MGSEFIRIYKAVHTWAGILAGLALFIAFYAGALTVFQGPLTEWATPPTETRLTPLDETPQLIRRTLAADPRAAREFTIHLDEGGTIPARMGWQLRDPQADEHDTASLRHFVASLDATGAAQVESIHPNRLASFIDVLHRVVGLPVDTDETRWVMGGIAVLYTLALFSGVVVLLPALVKDFFALRVGRNLKRMWLDAHNVVGIISLPFHLVMALTAAVFAFHDGLYAVQDKLVHGGQWATAFSPKRPAPGAGVKAEPGRDPATLLPPLELVARVKAFSPGFVPSLLQYQQVTGPRPVVRIWGKDPAAVSPRARGGFAALDPYTGRLLSSDLLPGRQDTPNLFLSSFFALHMGAFGGTAVTWMYFLLALAGAWLFYSGNLLWIESRRKKQSRHHDGPPPAQRLATRMMAAATVGVSLGCVCGISLALVGNKWLHGWVADINTWHPILYYTGFFACIAWAFGRGAGRGAVHLLWLAAGLTLAIPLTSLVGGWLPASGLWAHASAASLGVDLTALVAALLFAWMARATARRVRCGPPDSVWSSPNSAADSGLESGSTPVGVEAAAS